MLSLLLSLIFSGVSQERNGWFETQMEEIRGASDWRDGEALLSNPMQQEIGPIFSLRLPRAKHHDFKTLDSAANYIALVETFSIHKYDV